MNINEFATITQQESFENFQPTACYPKRKEIRSLTGLPADIEPEPSILEWMAQYVSADEEFLVAFKSGSLEFTVIRQEGRKSESASFGSIIKPPLSSAVDWFIVADAEKL